MQKCALENTLRQELWMAQKNFESKLEEQRSYLEAMRFETAFADQSVKMNRPKKSKSEPFHDDFPEEHSVFAPNLKSLREKKPLIIFHEAMDLFESEFSTIKTLTI